MIVDESVIEYRRRREARKDRRRLDDDWITVNGTHVMVDDGGNVTKGPDALKGKKPPAKKAKGREDISPKMSPARTDYAYEPGDDRDDWVHKNVKKLKPLYDEGGSGAIDAEWYKYRMAKSTKDVRQMSKREADEIVYDCPYVTQSLYDGWFRNADSSYKPKLTNAIVSTPEMRSAALSLAYENYRSCTDKPLPFEEFLTTPIKMYRGENGQKKIEDDVFDAYSFDRDMARRFAANGPNARILEVEVRPIDTYGSMRAVGESEIWVPRELAKRSNADSVEENDDGWDWKDPVRWAFEDYELGIKPDLEFDLNEDLLNSIVRDTEMIELFAQSKSENDKAVAGSIIERCIESIQRTVAQMTALRSATKADSAFFAGELDDNLGEKEILYPEHVVAFKERRQKRLDARLDDEGRWVTTEEDHRIHLNEEGVPDKGNPYVIKAMTSGTKTPEELGKGKFQKTRDRVKKKITEYHALDEEVGKLAEAYARANKEFSHAERKLEFIDKIYKKTLSDNGIEEKDGEALRKEVEDLARKRAENPMDREIEAQYNNRHFLLLEYEDVYGDETKELRKDFGRLKKENDDAKKKLDGSVEKRRSALKEAKKHMADRDAQSLKFYTDSERKSAVKSVMDSSAFSRMTQEEKDGLSESLNKASDAQLCVLQKTIQKAKIFRVGETATPDKCSHYNSAAGAMYMEDEDMGKPRVFWHEYGHFMDDTRRSGMDIKEVTRNEGSVYEGTSYTFSSLLRDGVKIYGEDAAKDLQEMFDKVAPGLVKAKTNEYGDWISVSGTDDAMSEVEFSMRMQDAFDKAVKSYLDGGPDGGKLAEYYRSVGYPPYEDVPKREDYFVSYVTPKRKLEREKEKFKGAEQKYWDDVSAFYDKRREIEENTPGFREKVGELTRERSKREMKVPPVTDCLCAALHGAVFSIYGCHDPDYYRRGSHAEDEWAANIHQMMFMGEKEALDFMTSLMPRTMKKVKAAYNEYLWRNME